MSEPQEIEGTAEEKSAGATLADEEIETRPLGGTHASAVASADDGDDSGDTGDDSGDTSDTSDTGDDSGSSDTGDDSGASS